MAWETWEEHEVPLSQSERLSYHLRPWFLPKICGNWWFQTTCPSLSEDKSYFTAFLKIIWHELSKLSIDLLEKCPCMVTKSLLLVKRESHFDFLRLILLPGLFPFEGFKDFSPQIHLIIRMNRYHPKSDTLELH